MVNFNRTARLSDVNSSPSPLALGISSYRSGYISKAVASMQSRIDKAVLKLETEGMPDYPKTSRDSGYKARLREWEFLRDVRIERSRKALLAKTELMAGKSFDSYVAKLEAKIGEHDSAELVGDLWQYSTVKVTKGSQTEIWTTQIILNVSSLGKLFNQWPTRRIR